MSFEFRFCLSFPFEKQWLLTEFEKVPILADLNQLKSANLGLFSIQKPLLFTWVFNIKFVNIFAF